MANQICYYRTGGSGLWLVNFNGQYFTFKTRKQVLAFIATLQ
jgi:hypothetical protein